MGTKCSVEESDGKFAWVVKDEQQTVVAKGPLTEESAAQAGFARARVQVLSAVSHDEIALHVPSLTPDEVVDVLRVAASAIRTEFASSPDVGPGSTFADEIDDVLRRLAGEFASHREVARVPETVGWLKGLRRKIGAWIGGR